MTTANNQALAAMRDIHLPPAVSPWPLAPGWYILIAILAVLVILSIYSGSRYWQKTKVKRIALKQLHRLKAKYKAGSEIKQIPQRVSLLLRKVALTYYAKEDIAGITGDHWLSFLDKSAKTKVFSQHRELLLSAPYQRNADVDIEALINISIQWVKSCHV